VSFVNINGLTRAQCTVAPSLLASVPPAAGLVAVVETHMFQRDPSHGIAGWSWLAGSEQPPSHGNRVRRGQGLFVRDTWRAHVSVVTRGEYCSWFRLTIPGEAGSQYALGLVYLPPVPSLPAPSFREETASIFAVAARERAAGRVPLLVGDWNCELRPRRAGRPVHRGHGSTLEELMVAFDLARVCPLVERPTFRRGPASSTVDHALVPARAAARFQLSVAPSRAGLLPGADHFLLHLSLPHRVTPDATPGQRAPATALRRLPPARSSGGRKDHKAWRKEDAGFADLTALITAAPSVDEATALLTSRVVAAADRTCPPRSPRSRPREDRPPAVFRRRDEAARQVRQLEVRACVLQHLGPAASCALGRARAELSARQRDVRAFVTSARLRRLRRVAADWQRATGLPALQWSQERRARSFGGLREPQSVLGPTGALITDPEAVAGQYAAFAGRQRANLAATTDPILRARHAAIHARLGPRTPYLTVNSEMDEPFSTPELQTALRQQRSFGAANPVERLQPWFLRYAGPHLFKAMLTLFNRVWGTTTWPASWCKAHIVYLLKQGPGRVPTHIPDHRPIELLKVLSKTFTRLFNNRLSPVAEASGHLPDPANGFRFFRGCDDNLLYATELGRRVCSGTSDKVFCIFFDVSSAFPSVDLTILFDTVQTYIAGARGRVLAMLRSMFARVLRSVVVGPALSAYLTFLSGLPQGDTTSPQLFGIIFAIVVTALDGSGLGVDAPYGETKERAGALNLADDHLAATNNFNEIQPIITRVGNRMYHELGMELSDGRLKCAVSVYTRDTAYKKWFNDLPPNTFQYRGVPFPTVDQYRYHGVYIGGITQERSGRYRLDWRKTLTERTKAFRVRLWQLLRSTCNWACHPTRVILHMYRAELRPILDYATAFMCLSKREISQMNQLQWEALRQFLCGGSKDKRRYSETVLVLETAVLPWEYRRAELMVRTLCRLQRREAAHQGSRRTGRIFAHGRGEFYALASRNRRTGLHCRPRRTSRPRPLTEVQTARELRAETWRGSIVSEWVAAHTFLGLSPEWFGLFACPQPGRAHPAAAAYAEVERQLAAQAALGAPPVSLVVRTQRLVRHCAWASLLGDTRKSGWRHRAGASHRLASVDWAAIQNGPVPRGVPTSESHVLGRLVQRLLRLGALPLGQELVRCSWQLPSEERPRISSMCPCCPEAFETASHFVLGCPATATRRAAWIAEGTRLFADSPMLCCILRGTLGGPSMRLALALLAGPAAWPRHPKIPCPVPLHGLTPNLPLIGIALAAFPARVLVHWARLSTFFLAAAWKNRCCASHPSHTTPTPRRSPVQLLLGPAHAARDPHERAALSAPLSIGP